MTSIDRSQSANSEIAVVALGGGHGLANTIKAARLYASEISAVVTLADDGGSSGKLRVDYGIPAPGDVRRCLSALASNDSLLATSLEYRHSNGMFEGHPLGNLLLASLALASGDFEAAVDEVGRLVGAVGSVYPATRVPVVLVADTDQGIVSSQVEIDRSTSIRNLRFEPADPPVPSGAVKAIANADQVLLGAGSFYSSVLAAATVPKIQSALNDTAAQRVLIANVSGPQRIGSAVDIGHHVEVLSSHDLKIDVLLADTSLDMTDISGLNVVTADLASEDGWSHDPARLAAALKSLSVIN